MGCTTERDGQKERSISSTDSASSTRMPTCRPKTVRCRPSLRLEFCANGAHADAKSDCRACTHVSGPDCHVCCVGVCV